jgi:hypothetical protein
LFFIFPVPHEKPTRKIIHKFRARDYPHFSQKPIRSFTEPSQNI